MNDNDAGAAVTANVILSTGWRWFEYHAKQRLDTFKFFLTIYSATGAAGAILYDRGFVRLSLGLGIVALFACFVFWRMDMRSRKLIGFGEDLLDEALQRERIPV